MSSRVIVYDTTTSDHLSKVRGIGRYLQVLKEALPNALFTSDLSEASSHDVLINPFVNFLTAPLINKRFVQKQIAVIHDLIPLKYSEHFPSGVRGKLNIFTNKQALKHYDTIVTDSEASKKDLMSLLKIPHAKIEIIYPALQKIFFGKNKSDRSPEPFCIYVGDATWNKNLAKMARAVLLADVQCVIVGKVFNTMGGLDHPWQRELKQFFEIAKDDPHFIFPGYVSDEELLSLYQKASCNLLVSRDEGFGYSYFEAASQGTPSVLSDIPVFKETAGNAAVFVDHNDEEAIADGIHKLMTDKISRNKISRKLKEQSKKVAPETFQRNISKLL